MVHSDLDPASLVGTWRLVDWTVRRADGSTARPLGSRPVGMIVYTADGQVSGQMMAPDRPRFTRSRPTASDIGDGDPAEIVSAFNGYVAYFGTYVLDRVGGIVRHRVQGALIPNWEGVELVRTAHLDGDDLVLCTPEVAAGGTTQTGALRWRRESARA